MIGAITAPAVAAQGICDRLVAAGVTSILNFAPVVLSVPEGVDVRKVDLSIELQILAFHAQRRSALKPPQSADAEVRPLDGRKHAKAESLSSRNGAAPDKATAAEAVGT